MLAPFDKGRMGAMSRAGGRGHTISNLADNRTIAGSKVAGRRAPWLLPVLSIALTLFFLLGPAYAAQDEGEVKACLACHGKKGSFVTFQNNEKMSLYVDEKAFTSSTHRFLACSDCHTGFSARDHPERKFKSREQFSLRLSAACRRCHPDRQLQLVPVHDILLANESHGSKVPVCTDCHGAHSVKPVAGGKFFKDETNYCMSCHARPMEMAFLDGGKISLKVDTGAVEASAHGKLGCTDCHFGFSSEEHPQRKFRTGKDFSITSAETCRRCHFDKYTETLGSIHYALLSQGNLSAPICTDCHGSHAIKPVTGEGKTVIIERCRRCHGAVYNIYMHSVHGQALLQKGNTDAPVCIDCHHAHDIKDPAGMDFREKTPEMCGNCHSNPALAAKYGLSTAVVKTYLSDFHGMTLNFYRQQKDAESAKPIAVCTDCHGTHDIQSMAGSSPAVIKSRLVNRCRVCHKGATSNFPDTWLYHYAPSFSKTPLVFLVERVYRVLIPVMIIGLVLQVLLHIWRYTINR